MMPAFAHKAVSYTHLDVYKRQVYAVMADGRGTESVLGSIDQVTDQLRGKLGEALQSVQKTSVPLPNVATPSLDALRAFAVARSIVNTCLLYTSRCV